MVGFYLMSTIFGIKNDRFVAISSIERTDIAPKLSMIYQMYLTAIPGKIYGFSGGQKKK